MVEISPSILSADFSYLADAVADLEKAKADMIHIDVMDGIFVPNISFGFPICKAIKEHTNLRLDVHLMIQKPQLYIEQFAKYAERISIHYESDCDVDETLKMIKDCGCIPSLTIKPNTPAEAVFPYLDKVGMVLVMSVEPGFGGQSFMPSSIVKIAKIREKANQMGLNLDIQVDGGINTETAPLVYKAGANILVAGSAVFNTTDMTKTVADLKKAAQN